MDGSSLSDGAEKLKVPENMGKFSSRKEEKISRSNPYANAISWMTTVKSSNLRNILNSRLFTIASTPYIKNTFRLCTVDYVTASIVC